MVFNWNEDKNRLLRTGLGISFEEIVVAIESGGIRDVLKHPNARRYPNQQVFVVEYKDYAYAVPFVINAESDTLFLKTIYPSRRLTRTYIGTEVGHDE